MRSARHGEIRLDVFGARKIITGNASKINGFLFIGIRSHATP